MKQEHKDPPAAVEKCSGKLPWKMISPTFEIIGMFWWCACYAAAIVLRVFFKDLRPSQVFICAINDTVEPKIPPFFKDIL